MIKKEAGTEEEKGTHSYITFSVAQLSIKVTQEGEGGREDLPVSGVSQALEGRRE